VYLINRLRRALVWLRSLSARTGDPLLARLSCLAEPLGPLPTNTGGTSAYHLFEPRIAFPTVVLTVDPPISMLSTHIATDSAPAGYIYLFISQLPELQLVHRTSAIDMSISLPEALDLSEHIITGYTEWTARWRDSEVSIGWDWAFANETILLIHSDEIRSNVRLVGTDRAPTSPDSTRRHLASWLETHPWREGVVRELVRRNRRPTQ
jgi:hypothetical protein